MIFVSAGTPIPLYNTYRALDGLTNSDLSFVTAVYLVSAVVSLLVLGRLSDHVGRRPVAIAALLVSAVGLVALEGVDGVLPLALGRLCQGLATGMASSALGAYAVDLAPARPAWLAAVVTSAAPMLGIPSGALLSGALADYGPSPRHLTYAVVLVLLLAGAAVIGLSTETVPRTSPREALASMRPRVLVPTGTGRRMLAMGGLIVATWSMGGFYQAFGPSIAAQWEQMLLAELGKPFAEADEDEKLAAYVRRSSRSVTRSELLLMLDAATHPGFRAPWARLLQRWTPSITADADEAILDRMVTRLSADGLWFLEAFTDTPIDDGVREKLARRLSQPLVGA